MKILRLNFSNINSLKGVFEIDFTDPALSAHGIFAITGRTGAGKTSILDAVTLALYGKTPRLTFSPSENELMTRGTASCHSEITFESFVDGRILRFRSRWEQRRARNRADGNLQAARMQIFQEADEPDKKIDSRWASSKLSEVPLKVEEITGLNYDRFVRTCLLAQGQFAAFLDAKAADRAQILEQITGTDIYRKLSIEAYARYSAVKNKIQELLHKLSAIEPVSDETFFESEKTEAMLKSELNAAESRKSELQRCLEQINDLQNLIEREQQLLRDFEKLTHEKADHAESFEKLKVGEAAEPARSLIVKRDDLLGRRLKRSEELLNIAKNIEIAQNTLAEIDAEYKALLAEESALQKQTDSEREIISEVIELDRKIANLCENRNKLVERENELKQALLSLNSVIQSADSNIANADLQKRSLEHLLEETSIDSALEGDLKVLEREIGYRGEILDKKNTLEKETATLIEMHLQAARHLEDLKTTLSEIEAEICGSEKALKEAEKALANQFGETTPSTLQTVYKEAIQKLSSIRQIAESAAELRNAFSETRALETKIKERAAVLKRLECETSTLESAARECETQLEALTEQKAAYSAIASFEEQRRSLEDGKPCPLCGALEHPFARGIEAESLLQKIDKDLKAFKSTQKRILQELTEKRNAFQKLSAQQELDENTLRTLVQTTATRTEQWQQAAVEYPYLSIEDEESQRQLVADAEAALEAAEKDIATFQSMSIAVHEAAAALSRAREKSLSFANARENASAALKECELKLSNAEKRKLELELELSNSTKQISNVILVYGYSEFDEDVLPQLYARRKVRQENQKKLENAVVQLNTAQKAKLSAQAEYEAADKQLDGLMRELQQLESHLTALKQERLFLYSDRDPLAEEQRLLNSLKQLRENVEKAQERRHSAEVAFEQLRVQERLCQTDLRCLENELIETQELLKKACHECGFKNESELEAALLPPQELKNLTELKRRFETQEAQMRGSLEALKKQLAEHEAQGITKLSREEISGALLEADEKLKKIRADWSKSIEKLAVQSELREKYRQLSAEKERISKAGERWNKLNELIGSAEGDKFQKFAQGLTFSNLVYHANRQLEKLTDRYSLANVGLELGVVDNYIPGTKATAKNLSGGEKFLASLALALALAQIIGRKHRMDTLFIDEGFGALDPETLETAISALCALQRQDKLIGVISHVEMLQERIPAKIEVIKTGGGYSSIEGPGCKKI